MVLGLQEPFCPLTNQGLKVFDWPERNTIFLVDLTGLGRLQARSVRTSPAFTVEYVH